MDVQCDPQLGCGTVRALSEHQAGVDDRLARVESNQDRLCAKIDRLVDQFAMLWKTGLLFVLSSVLLPLLFFLAEIVKAHLVGK